MASEEPVVAVPTACLESEACQSLAIMEMQRVWIRVVAGYSSESTGKERGQEVAKWRGGEDGTTYSSSLRRSLP